MASLYCTGKNYIKRKLANTSLFMVYFQGLAIPVVLPFPRVSLLVFVKTIPAKRSQCFLFSCPLKSLNFAAFSFCNFCQAVAACEVDNLIWTPLDTLHIGWLVNVADVRKLFLEQINFFFRQASGSWSWNCFQNLHVQFWLFFLPGNGHFSAIMNSPKFAVSFLVLRGQYDISRARPQWYMLNIYLDRPG